MNDLLHVHCTYTCRPSMQYICGEEEAVDLWSRWVDTFGRHSFNARAVATGVHFNPRTNEWTADGCYIIAKENGGVEYITTAQLDARTNKGGGA